MDGVGNDLINGGARAMIARINWSVLRKICTIQLARVNLSETRRSSW